MSLYAHSLVITPEILSLVAEIEEFKGAWTALGRLAPDRLQALRRAAAIESIGSSIRIEGARLSDAEVERLLSKPEITPLESPGKQEVAGYARVLETVFDSYEQIDLTENHIHQLHRDLLIHCDTDEHHRGNYNTGPYHVSIIKEKGDDTKGDDTKSDDIKSTKIKDTEIGDVFDTTSWFETPFLMQELVDWARHALIKGRLHPLLVIGIFTVTFLEIHPFQDGNGRISRVVTSLLLLRAGYTYIPYASLESVIEKTKDRYYLALRRTQCTIRTRSPEWEPWLTYFLTSLVDQKRNLEVKIDREMTLLSTLPELSQQIVILVKEHGTLTLRHMVELTNANRNTIKKHVAALVQARQLIKNGTGRGTWYSAEFRIVEQNPD